MWICLAAWISWLAPALSSGGAVAADVPAAPAEVAPPGGAARGAAPPGRRPQAEDIADDSDESLRAIAGSDDPPRSRLNRAAWSGVGLTVALLGIAGFYGASAAGKEGDVNRLLDYRNETTGAPVEYASVAETFEDDLRVGRRDNRIAKVMVFSALGAAAVSAALFLIDGLRGPAAEPGLPRRSAAALPDPVGTPAGWSVP